MATEKPTGNYDRIMGMVNEVKEELGEPTIKSLDLVDLEKISERIKSSGSSLKDYSVMFQVFLIAFLLLTMWRVYEDGYVYLVPMGLLLLYYIYQRSTLAHSPKGNSVAEVYNENGMISAMQYVKSGIDRKLARANYQMMLWILFFPLLCWLAIEAINGSLGSPAQWYFLAAAYAINTIIWLTVYRKDKSEISSYYTDIERIKGEYVSRGAV